MPGKREKASKELIALVPRLAGDERDTALVKIGVAQYIAKDTKAAQKYLAELIVRIAAGRRRAHVLPVTLCAPRQRSRQHECGARPTGSPACQFHRGAWKRCSPWAIRT